MNTTNNKAFMSWSGGKDCCLALFHALKQGLEVRALASMMTIQTGLLWPHQLSPATLKIQAEALDIPLVEWWTTVPDYDKEFTNMLTKFKHEGIDSGIFGNINDNSAADLHLAWINKLCRNAGIVPQLPLWNSTRESILEELINLGFEVVIIAADNEHLGEKWLGRKIDSNSINELKGKCSCNGELRAYYHTFVTDGPIFKKKIVINSTNVLTEGDRLNKELSKPFTDAPRPSEKSWFQNVLYLEIANCELRGK